MITLLPKNIQQSTHYLARWMRVAIPAFNSTQNYVLMETSTNVSYMSTTKKCDNKYKIEKITLDVALDFLGASSGWQSLNQQLGEEAFDNCIFVLHPSLYLLQTVTGSAKRPQIVSNLVNKIKQIDNKYLHYSSSSNIINMYPRSLSIIPYAELIRIYANRMHLMPPWIIANENYIWVSDKRNYFYELSTHSDCTPTIIASLINDKFITTSGNAIAVVKSNGHNLLKKLAIRTKINTDIVNIESMLIQFL